MLEFNAPTSQLIRELPIEAILRRLQLYDHLMQPLVKVNSKSNNLAVLDTILERNSQDSFKLNI